MGTISGVWVHAVTAAVRFVNEGRIIYVLDYSLYNVPTGTRQPILRISRAPRHDWQLNCEVDIANFMCAVQIERLFVIVCTPVHVSNAESLVWSNLKCVIPLQLCTFDDTL